MAFASNKQSSFSFFVPSLSDVGFFFFLPILDPKNLFFLLHASGSMSDTFTHRASYTIGIDPTSYEIRENMIESYLPALE